MRFPLWILIVALCATIPVSAAAQGAPPDAAPAPVSEAQKKKASEHWRRGVEFYRNRDFRNALIEFKRAHETAPSYQVLFNLGQTSFELKDYVEAKHAFEAYLAQGGDKIEASRRAEVEAELEKLATYVANLELVVNVDDADIAVDDIAAGKTPLKEPLLVSAGRRKIEIRKAGYAPIVRYVDIGGGETKPVELELVSLEVKTAPPVPPSPEQPKLPPEEERSHVDFWASLGVTLGLGIATGVVGGLALKAKGDYDDEADTFPTTKQALDDAADKVDTLSLLTDVLGGVTAATAIATIVVGVFSFSDDDEEAVSFSVSPTGLSVSGSF